MKALNNNQVNTGNTSTITKQVKRKQVLEEKYKESYNKYSIQRTTEY